CACGDGAGGGIANNGTTTITGSTFRFNQAAGGNDNHSTGAFPGLGFGGAIGSSGPKLMVSDSIFDHYQAVGGNRNSGVPGTVSLAPGAAFGGGIDGFARDHTINRSTVAHNHAIGGNETAG